MAAPAQSRSTDLEALLRLHGIRRVAQCGVVHGFDVGVGFCMWWAQSVLSDAERPEWAWVPLKGVGPLRFGQTVEEVAAALGEPINGWHLQKQWVPFSALGVDTYYTRDEQTLAAISIDACNGPQVLRDGVRFVGRLPSELTPWIEATADSLKDMPQGLDGLRIGLNGEAGLPGLGLVMRCQQNGDFARTRPVFVAAEWAEMCTDSWEGSIPQREWGVH
ncbi:hypothetical protein V2W30_20150 [Streptomyces sp. Q6]|uniref:Uncharacterized protein n=1 Tax=Streptomyces citrinus TaxID=3118173 RepID=A0ACD5ADV0_9ACTN